MLAWLLGAVLLLALRVVHGRRFPRSMGQLEDEDRARARVESAREWLPMLDEDRTNLNPVQVQLLDALGKLLMRLASPLLKPSTCFWWRSKEELRIYVPIQGRGAAGVKSGYMFLPTHVRMAYFVEYGLVDRGAPSRVLHDFEFRGGSGRPVQVAVDAMNAPGVIAEVASWLEGVLAEPTATRDELDPRRDGEE